MPALPTASFNRRTSACRLLRLVRVLLPVLLGLLGPVAEACTVCRPRVQAAIHDQHYAANLLLLSLPVALLLLLGAGLYFADDLKQRFAQSHG